MGLVCGWTCEVLLARVSQSAGAVTIVPRHLTSLRPYIGAATTTTQAAQAATTRATSESGDDESGDASSDVSNAGVAA